MRKIIAGIVIGALGVYAHNRYFSHASPSEADLVELPAPAAAPGSRFRCDGRVHCAQMTSCEEAAWFLRNCSGVKMDGDRDGLPCEERCGHR